MIIRTWTLGVKSDAGPLLKLQIPEWWGVAWRIGVLSE